MKQNLRIWISSTLLAVVLLTLLPSSAAFPNKHDGPHQAAFSYDQKAIAGEHDLAVGAENEIENYQGHEVWRFKLPSTGFLDAHGRKQNEIAQQVLSVAGVSGTSARLYHDQLALTYKLHFIDA
jgi:hypothetical protein